MEQTSWLSSSHKQMRYLQMRALLLPCCVAWLPPPAAPGGVARAPGFAAAPDRPFAIRSSATQEQK